MAVFNTADILIPQNIDFTKWSVVACDQYTSEPDYWEDVKNFTDGSPSSLNIIFPEVYLGKGGDNERIKNINNTMEQYVLSGLFKEIKDAFIYVERIQPNGKVRKGIVGALDLEEYDFSVGSKSKIRATEGTITERIPPRQRIRENALLETPHILILADDREKAIIEPLHNKVNAFEKLYDFDLMKNAGHITGYSVDEASKEEIKSAIENLENKKKFYEKYGVKNKGVLTFAVGDGNHSLATAKSCWNEIKKGLTESEAKIHPARYALAEIVNIHEDALEFEPIHRVVFDTEPEKLLNAFIKYIDTYKTDNKGQRIRYIYGQNKGSIYIADTGGGISVGVFQKFLDEYLKENTGRVDYIHGDDVVEKLCKNDKTIGFMFDAIEKNNFFKAIVSEGSLPRKTFSMGTAADKRFYLECKKIR